MELSFLIFKDLAAKFLIALTGFLAVCCKVCKKEDSQILASYTLYFTGPLALFNAYQRDFSMEMLARLGIAIAVSFGIIFVSIVLSFAAQRIFHLEEVNRAALVYSNNGSFIISLVNALLGSEAVFYLSGYITANILTFFGLDFARLSGGKKSSWKSLLNPNVLAIFVGLIFFIGSLRLPGTISAAAAIVGDMHGSLTMVMLGMALGSCKIKETFSQVSVWLLSLARLIAVPLIEVFLLALCGITRRAPELYSMMNVLIIAASCPVANNILQVTLLNKEVSKETLDTAISVNTVSTCLCIVTIPLMTAVYSVLH